MLTVHKIAISKKLSPLVHLGSCSLITWIFGIIHQIIRKDLSKNEIFLICRAKHDDHPTKVQEGINGSFLSFATKYRCRVAYDLNVEAISFAIGQGCRRSQLI